MKIVIITGLSGAGKTSAANWFEDQGYYCVDNMPPPLVPNFLSLVIAEERIDRVAIVADVRTGGFFDELEETVNELRSAETIDCKVVFLEASTDSIVRRYNETRRNHPLTGGKVSAKVIEDEREMLLGIRKPADYIIDTTGIRGNGLANELTRIFIGNGQESFSINITSFGYKFGIPAESDLVFDMRFIPNPYYVQSLRKLTGNNKKVRDYVLKADITKQFIRSVDALVNELIPGYINEGKSHLNIAFGCTGGHHRSVAVANEMARIFSEQGNRVTVTHRDLDFITKGR
ncbi:MAG: RNase adapter RapZ [Mogibacterium sp.]|nr:RNase adapter RapZ [Mogibacterium sp.]